VSADLVTQLARETERRYYGKYRGRVVDNADPQKQGRLKLLVPSVLAGTETDWANPVLAFGGTPDTGLFLLPEVDAEVWVEFEEGNLSLPLWSGFAWPAGQASGGQAVGDAAKRVLQTPCGHRIELDDSDGAERLVVTHKSGATLTLDENGGVLLADQGGSGLEVDASAGKLTLSDANGNALTMDAQGVVLEDAAGNRIEMAAAGLTVKGTLVKVEGQQVMLG
jgi:uncharacterized protein involved in type VI secretion and phage assembly